MSVCRQVGHFLVIVTGKRITRSRLHLLVGLDVLVCRGIDFLLGLISSRRITRSRLCYVGSCVMSGWVDRSF